MRVEGQAGARGFRRDESGAATMDHVVAAGLIVAVSVVLLLNVSEGTTGAATGPAADLPRGGAAAVECIPPTGSGSPRAPGC